MFSSSSTLQRPSSSHFCLYPAVLSCFQCISFCYCGCYIKILVWETYRFGCTELCGALSVYRSDLFLPISHSYKARLDNLRGPNEVWYGPSLLGVFSTEEQ
ncbi:hypothetical protein GALMADRAFT_799192 [Galerina marginata CBS 339.88]|uniref:Uncharacterized protein n=1 Tax=Galerina marginata (strain CBS 339.88) TaxID=685588 RepID=A0A067SUF9_GALM3|nr:hypothetical protein GALMADRAFT_799192 [Galerina marginata CBS 339.88]